MEILSRFFARLAELSARHSKIVLGLAGLMTLVSLLGISRLSIDLKASSLLPKDLPSLEEYRRQTKEFGRTEFLVVVIEPAPGISLRKYRHFIARYKRALQALSITKGEHLNLSEELLENINEYIIRHGVYLVEPSHLERINTLLSPESIRDKLAVKKGKSVRNANNRFDPLGLITLAEQYFLPSKNIFPDRSGEYYVTRDQRLAFFVFGSVAPGGKTEQTEKLLKQANILQNKIWNQLDVISDGHLSKTLPLPRITWTGLPIILLEDAQTLRAISLNSILLCLLGVVLLFVLFFSGLRSIIFAFFPLILGVLWSFGFAGFFLGSLNIATAGLGAILIGLGIDFPAYLLNAFYRRIAEGQTFHEALRESWGKSGRSVFFGALSTSASFLMLLLTRLEAFRELGVLAGVGLLLTFAAVILILPAVLASFSVNPANTRVRRLPGFFVNLPIQKSRIVIVVCLILFVCFAGFSGRLKIDMNFTETHAEGTPSMRLQDQLAQSLDNSLRPLMLIVTGKDWEEALIRNERLVALLSRYQKEGKIKHYDTLSRWLPSRKSRTETLKLLREMKNLNPAIFEKNFSQAKPKLNFLTEGNYERYKNGIVAALKARQFPSRSRLKAGGLKVLLDRYSRHDDYRTRLVSYIYLPRVTNESAYRVELLERLAREGPFKEGWANFVAEETILNEMEEIIRTDLYRVGGAILIIIAVVLWLSFRSLSLVLIGLTPMLLGMAAMLGSYALLKDCLSGVNLLFIPLYVGLAIDDAIHLINQVRLSGSLHDAMNRVGMPILFTSLTTIVGFGSLMLGPFPIMQQAGLLIVLAMTWELIGSLFFLPALLIHRKRGANL